MINQYDEGEDKGLFTFYRQQAQIEEKLREQKKQRKLRKIRERQQLQLQKQRERIANEQKQQFKKKQQKIQQEKRKKLNQSVQRKPLYEPRYRNQKYEKQKIGQSVIIVSQSSPSSPRNWKIEKSKESLHKIEKLINAKNRYFLQNQELPIQFGSSSIQRQIAPDEEQEKKTLMKPVSVKLSYFNKSGENLELEEMQKKRIGGISYEKLPEITKKMSKPSSYILSSKKYKSQKIQQALKSSNSEVIRNIRKNISEELMLQKEKQRELSPFINFNKHSYYNEVSQRQNSGERQKTYGGSPNFHSLNEKQKKLMEIIQYNYLNKKRN